MHVNGKVGMPDVPPPPEGVFDMLRLERMERTILTGQRHPFAGFGRIPSADEVVCGLWLHQPLINHGCDPNLAHWLFGDVQVHPAARPIKKGEQVFHRYFYVTQVDTMKERDFVCKCPLCLTRVGDPRNARRMAIYEQLAGKYPKLPKIGVFEPLFAEFEKMDPVACEIGLLSELRHDVLKKAGRTEEARAALIRAEAAYAECGSMSERRFWAIVRLRPRSKRAKGEELSEEEDHRHSAAVMQMGIEGWGISPNTFASIFRDVMKLGDS